MVSKIIMDSLDIYVDWTYFCNAYMHAIEKQDRERFLATNIRYQRYMETRDSVSDAVGEYVKGNKEKCKDILLEASDIFDELFDEKYNPALVNVCFMARRGEIPGINISVIEVLNKVTWMGEDAFLNINKALVYVEEGRWEDTEKNIVLLLLTLENKIPEGIDIIKLIEFWKACNDIKNLPDEIKKELLDLQNKYLVGE